MPRRQLLLLPPALRAPLTRLISLEMGNLVKITLPPETLHQILELIEACGAKLVALDLHSNELRAAHAGLLAERLHTCSNLASLCLAYNRLDLQGLRRLGTSASSALTQVGHSKVPLNAATATTSGKNTVFV